MNILFIGAHFDDVEMGAGGTLWRHNHVGDEVYIAVTSSDEYRTGAIEMRMEEQRQSLDMIHLLMDRLLLFKRFENIAEIVTELDLVKPDVLYIPHHDDTHQDHIRAFTIGRAVGRKPKMDVFFYEGGAGLHFIPNVFVPIAFEMKEKLIRCFKSQNLDINRIEKRDAFTATLAGINGHAEGFIADHLVIGKPGGWR